MPVVRSLVAVAVAAGTHHHPEIAGGTLRVGCIVVDASIDEQTGGIFIGLVNDGGDAGAVSGRTRNIDIVRLALGLDSHVNTILVVILTGNRIAHRLAGHVLDQQPGRK